MITLPETKPHIQVILGSTREGRFGTTVAEWFMSIVREREDFHAELIDLRDWPLPFFDTANPPSSGEIAPEARNWSAKISEADGYVIITPEYNRGIPAVLKNALDYLWYEWNNKPLGLVGYGGAAGGARALANLRLIAMELEMAPVRVEVTLVSARRIFDENGNLKEPHYVDKANQMLDQVVAWAHGFKAMRHGS